jgi:hypothetical protein
MPARLAVTLEVRVSRRLREQRREERAPGLVTERVGK